MIIHKILKENHKTKINPTIEVRGTLNRAKTTYKNKDQTDHSIDPHQANHP